MTESVQITSNENHSPASVMARIDNPIEAVEKMGMWFCRSGMFGCDKPEQGMILAMASLCEGKSPIEIAATYHLIGGSISMQTRAMLAKFRQRGGKVLWKKTTEKLCESVWHWEGAKTTVTYTIEEAQNQGLIKPGSGWEKIPAEMLRARATTRAITMLAPEILVIGGHTADADDVEPKAAVVEEIPAPTNPITESKKALPAPPTPPPPAAEAPKVVPAPKAKAPKKASKPKPAPIVDAEVIEPASDEFGTAPEPEPDSIVTKIIKVKQLLAKAEATEPALTWLVANGWILADDSIQDLKEKSLDRILDAPEKFLRAAKRAVSA